MGLWLTFVIRNVLRNTCLSVQRWCACEQTHVPHRMGMIHEFRPTQMLVMVVEEVVREVNSEFKLSRSEAEKDRCDPFIT